MRPENDEVDEIENSEEARQGAKAVRRVFNAYLAEGFTETQALELVKANIIAANQ